MIYFYLALATLAVVSAFAFKRDLLSPGRVFVGIYALLLAINSLELSKLQIPWSSTTHFIFWSALGAFVLDCLISGILFKVRNPVWKFDAAEIRNTLLEDASRINWKWLLTIWAWSSAVFIVSYVISIFLFKGLPVFSDTPETARLKFFGATTLTNYGMFFGPISMILAAEYLILKKQDKVWWWMAGALAILFTMYFTVITRFELFRFFLFAAVMYHYGRKPLGPSQVLIGATLVFALFLGIFMIRSGQNIPHTIKEMGRVGLPEEWLWLTSPYAYVTCNFWNMNYAITRFTEGEWFYPTQFGFGFFRGFLFLSQMEWPLADAFGFDGLGNPSATMLSGYNTSVFVWHLFKDFGGAGAVVVTFLGGLFMSLFYWNMIARITVFRTCLFGLFFGGMVLSFQAPLWELWFFYLNIAIMIIAHRKISLA